MGYPLLALVAGAAGGFVSLEAPLVGFALAIAAGCLLVLAARHERWTTLGTFLLGLGGAGVYFLPDVLTNRDPAVTYDPSTIPVLVLSAAIGVAGACTLTIAVVRRAGAKNR